MGRPAKIATGLGARLAQIRKGMDRREFAESIGVNDGTLGNYERGDRSPDWSFLATLQREKHVNLNWLFTGQGDVFLQGGNDEQSPATERDFVLMPQYDVCASAGTGLLPVNQMPTSETAFERKFLRDLGGAPDHCFLMWSTGDSMLPSIPDNALLIVDASQTNVDHGRIYVFSVGNAVLVKRANWRMDGRLELISDNTAGKYPVETFDANRVEDLAVVGRVIFVGHPP
ncbi:XRE family transcriptional regulator [Agrobacterium vitis]|uniref:Helix-turn-helix domain-containing protein n=1 Tax=Agrobacterium vitis TaxID=373 RepID=A0A7K1RAY8_AGRVI|nr:XRE family transcriptional regulator [Agrobacterium vitis]MVA55285.1 helix-turn-helix domain-containing protein [Agrobacterium vitis]